MKRIETLQDVVKARKVNQMIKPGSLVQLTAEFCKSIQWHTPPINGLVIEVADRTAQVVWCDQTRPTPILLANIELHAADSTITDSFRQSLMKEFNVERK